MKRSVWVMAAISLLGCGGSGTAGHGATPTARADAPVGAQPLAGGPVGPTAQGGLIVSGPIEGGDVPDGSPVQVVWVVSAGSPDYAYVFGEGRTTGHAFRVELPGAPPAEALNNGAFGVGMVMLVKEPMAQGRSDDKSVLERSVRGLADRHGIIYLRRPLPQVEWFGRFQDGYGCGRGVPPAPGATFESFEPVPCDGFVLRIGDLDVLNPVNWT